MVEFLQWWNKEKDGYLRKTISKGDSKRESRRGNEKMKWDALMFSIERGTRVREVSSCRNVISVNDLFIAGMAILQSQNKKNAELN